MKVVDSMKTLEFLVVDGNVSEMLVPSGERNNNKKSKDSEKNRAEAVQRCQESLKSKDTCDDIGARTSKGV